MQKEYAQASEFGKWYKHQQEEMRKDSLYKFFLDLRNTTIHQKQVNPRIQVSFNVTDLFSMPSGSIIVLGDKQEGPYVTNGSVAKVPASESIKSRSIQKWYFDVKPDEDVISLCESYLSKVSAIVYECREKWRAL